ncbi:ATP-dependent DNA helicase RecQ-like isoform X2 [Halichondria panicea]|uniref:ATP-dependent DNA helicase RecQ-like isoform X2 n=1 Tax=Halichondria panicea TaxID=6063 RepID=UPI00312B76F8
MLLLEPPLNSSLVAIAVDEAHCVYKWSSDFRPAYAHLGELRAFAPPGAPILAANWIVSDLPSSSTAIADDVEALALCGPSMSKSKPFSSNPDGTPLC